MPRTVFSTLLIINTSSIVLLTLFNGLSAYPNMKDESMNLRERRKNVDSESNTDLEALKFHANDSSNCTGMILNDKEYVTLPNGDINIYVMNKTFKNTLYYLIGGQLCLLDSESEQPFKIIRHCKKWRYESYEFQRLENGSVLLYDEVLELGTFEFKGNQLITCVPENDPNDDDDDAPTYRILSEATMIKIGKAGTIISVIALSCHLIVFCIVPSMRNLPGYNLASLSLAFLLAYCFVIIGQIKEVLGTSCVISGILIQYFFLAAFFWMNTMTFDVWRALRLATQKLVSTSGKLKAKKFLLYSSYAWGVPMIITGISIAMDNASNIPDEYRPGYGRNDLCWINNDYAKLIFFVGPAFMLFVVNGIFFVVSAYMIVTNTMSDQQRVARRNFSLYVRMGLIMGITWSIGIISVLLKREELWFIFDVLNSLQGLFVFLFFTCSRKVLKHFRSTANTTSEVKSTSVQHFSTSK